MAAGTPATEALARAGVADPDVAIERVASIDRGPTGKAPLIATVRPAASS